MVHFWAENQPVLWVDPFPLSGQERRGWDNHQNRRLAGLLPNGPVGLPARTGPGSDSASHSPRLWQFEDLAPGNPPWSGFEGTWRITSTSTSFVSTGGIHRWPPSDAVGLDGNPTTSRLPQVDLTGVKGISITRIFYACISSWKPLSSTCRRSHLGRNKRHNYFVMMINAGQTANFVVWYDNSLTNSNPPNTGPALAQAVLDYCEYDLARLSLLFGGILPPRRRCLSRSTSCPARVELGMTGLTPSRATSPRAVPFRALVRWSWQRRRRFS